MARVMKRIKLIRTRDLEDFPPELLHHIQSLLPLKEAARTSVLSKAWLNAWSTIPTLRFREFVDLPNMVQQMKYRNLVNRTLLRYLRVPITSFKLQMTVDDGKSASSLEKWIQQIASKSCITEIHLKIDIYTSSFHLSDALFSGENLKKVNLRFFYHFGGWSWLNPILPITDSLANVRELYLDIKYIDDTFPNLFKSKFPYLESLSLKIDSYIKDILDITCVSLKRLIIKVRHDYPFSLYVFAPKLLFFRYTGDVTIPSFLFLPVAPQQIELNLKLRKPIDICFFLKIREALNLSSKFSIKISTSCDFIKQFDVDISDMRRQLPCPATNVQQLSFRACPGEELWGHSEFFDSFFSICNPSFLKTIRSIVPARLERYQNEKSV
ncbi:F-box protein-like protein [Tanacetum coccineum]|uniref:F-box protein-like protein n=1 Tax=Tanacetum coccineum TaxID=301880 RepID=A0ABQ5F7G9_9ASTR